MYALAAGIAVGLLWARVTYILNTASNEYEPRVVKIVGWLMGFIAFAFMVPDSLWWNAVAVIVAGVGGWLLWEFRSVAASIVKLPASYRFKYMDRDGDRTEREVRITEVGGWGINRYFKGHCSKRDAERTFRLDRVYGQLTDMTTGELIDPAALFKGRGGTLDPTPAQARRNRD